MQLRVLTEDDVQRIHEASLLVLERTGTWFKDCPEATELLGKHGCKVDGDRVRFPREVIAEALARVPDRNTMRFAVPSGVFVHDVGLKQGESHFALIGNAYYIHEYAKGSHRDCVQADVADKFLVLSALENFDIDFCGLLVQADRRAAAAGSGYDTVEACVEFLRRAVGDRADKNPRKLWPPQPYGRLAEEVRLDMLSTVVLWGEEAAREFARPVDAVWCNPISPLQFHPGEARGIIQVARSAAPERWIMISPEVMMGGTGPVTIAGTLVQHNAEVLAGTALAQSAAPGAPVIYGCVSAPMDLRNAEISHGNFETALINAGAVQLADRYRMPSRISPGNTSAKAPGARAAVEAAVGLALGIAAGGNIISTGLLDSTVTLSYEHLVVVNELINQVRNIAGPIRTDAESLALEVIEQCGHPSPEYLYCPHTVENMHRDIYYSDFCGRVDKSYEDWYEKAHKRVKEILDRKPLDEEANKDVVERLAAVEARLKEDPETWRAGGDGWWRFYVRDVC